MVTKLLLRVLGIKQIIDLKEIPIQRNDEIYDTNDVMFFIYKCHILNITKFNYTNINISEKNKYSKFIFLFLFSEYFYQEGVASVVLEKFKIVAKMRKMTLLGMYDVISNSNDVTILFIYTKSVSI